MSDYKFNLPSRQSIEGVFIIFGIKLYKELRQVLIILSLALFQVIKNHKSLLDSSIFYIIGILLLYNIVKSILEYRNFTFYLTHSHFILNKGILNKEETSISKSKIQNIYIKQNIIQQFLNVVSLAIETAGDNKTEVEIKALSKEKAHTLKVLLLKQKNNYSLGGEVKEEIVNKNSVYYEASVKKILLEGITENHLRNLAVIFSFFAGFYSEFETYITPYFKEIESFFNHIFLISIIIANVIILILFFIIVIAFSCVKLFLENYNLKVIDKTDGLELFKGLLNKINLSLKSSRLQTITVKTNVFKERLDLHKLYFTQAMLNKKQQKYFNIIGLSSTQIKEIITKFYPSIFKHKNKFKPEKYYLLKQVSKLIGVLLLFNMLCFFLPNIFYLVNFIIVFIGGIYAHRSYKKAFYSIDNDYVIIDSGELISTKTEYIEINKIQSVSLTQTMFQKSKHIASIKIYVASKVLVIPHLAFLDAQQILNYLIYKVEINNKNWM